MSTFNYNPFGMLMPGRNDNFGKYRFGFNNQESTNEIKGDGNHYEFKFRDYDPRIAKFWKIDPLFKDYAANSTYAFAENRVIDGLDLEGLEWIGAFIRVMATDASKLPVPNSTVVESVARPVTEIGSQQNKFTTEQLANFKRGNLVESEQLIKNGLQKNTKPIEVEVKPGEIVKTIPDAFKNGGKSTSEVKNVNRQSLTRQLKAQEKYSNDNGFKPELIINKSAKISQPLQNSSFDIKYYTPFPAPADNTKTNYTPIQPPSSTPQSTGEIRHI